MAEYKICFSVAGAFGAQISFEAKPGVSYEDAAASIDKEKLARWMCLDTLGYQSTGMTRYDNAYHKYEALADALDRDVQKADTRQAAASLKSELIMLASAASRAKLPSAPEGALLALAKEVIAVGRLYGYDGKEMDA